MKRSGLSLQGHREITHLILPPPDKAVGVLCLPDTRPAHLHLVMRGRLCLVGMSVYHIYVCMCGDEAMSFSGGEAFLHFYRSQSHLLCDGGYIHGVILPSAAHCL